MEELICNVSIKQEQEKREKNGVLIGLWCWEKDPNKKYMVWASDYVKHCF